MEQDVSVLIMPLKNKTEHANKPDQSLAFLCFDFGLFKQMNRFMLCQRPYLSLHNEKEILERIQALGGNIDQIKGVSWIDDLCAIRFNSVLYERPQDTPWAKADDQEPIYGLGEYIDQHQAELDKNPDAFFTQLIQEYYQLTEEGRGQSFWQPILFTPYKEGTADFKEWNDDFLDDDVDLNAIIQLTQNPKPELLQLFYRYSFPDHLYICVSDPCPENPTLFGTDHEVFLEK